MTEINEMRRMMVAVARLGTRIFRHNVAQGVVGNRIVWIKSEQRVVVRPGDAIVRGARVLHAGLVVGGSDLLGYTPVKITPEMVGMTVAVFTAIEAKDKTKLTDEQGRFIDQVNACGGIAGVAHSPDDAEALVRKYPLASDV